MGVQSVVAAQECSEHTPPSIIAQILRADQLEVPEFEDCLLYPTIATEHSPVMYRMLMSQCIIVLTLVLRSFNSFKQATITCMDS